MRKQLQRKPENSSLFTTPQWNTRSRLLHFLIVVSCRQPCHGEIHGVDYSTSLFVSYHRSCCSAGYDQRRKEKRIVQVKKGPWDTLAKRGETTKRKRKCCFRGLHIFSHRYHVCWTLRSCTFKSSRDHSRDSSMCILGLSACILRLTPRCC